MAIKSSMHISNTDMQEKMKRKCHWEKDQNWKKDKDNAKYALPHNKNTNNK